MNRFLNELVKAALAVVVLIGVILIAAGVVLLFCPEILRWGIVLLSVIGGISLCGCALYGLIKAKTP